MAGIQMSWQGAQDTLVDWRVMRFALACSLALAVLASAPAQAQPRSVVATVARSEPPWLGLLRPRQGSLGVQVVEVYEDSGAAAAGLLPGDELLFVDDFPVTNVAELVMVVRRYVVGDEVLVRALRAGAELRLKVTLGARVDDRELLHRRLVGKPAPSARLHLVQDDREIDPSAARGKVVLLAWFHTRCDGCGALISELTRRPGLLREVEVAAVTVAEPALLSTYLARSAISVPVALAQDEAFEQYGLLGGSADTAVAFVVIDRNGIVRMAAAIDARELEAAQASQASVEDVIAGARRLLRDRRW
ncbi:MAG: PDZ domain-containing protein [Myxococcales bacterium]|nr:PDZ domain-containing protein [Myxococcales bacterium]